MNSIDFGVSSAHDTGPFCGLNPVSGVGLDQSFVVSLSDFSGLLSLVDGVGPHVNSFGVDVSSGF